MISKESYIYSIYAGLKLRNKNYEEEGELL